MPHFLCHRGILLPAHACAVFVQAVESHHLPFFMAAVQFSWRPLHGWRVVAANANSWAPSGEVAGWLACRVAQLGLAADCRCALEGTKIQAVLLAARF